MLKPGNKQVKNLVKTMTLAEVNKYVADHPEWKIPNTEEAIGADKDFVDWDAFWISDKIGNRVVIYNHRKQAFYVTHPSFKHSVVLVQAGVL